MKATAILAALAAISLGGVASAEDSSISSANIVGYVTYNISANKKDIMGSPFINVGGTTFDIQNVTLSNPSDGCDWIMVFNPATVSYDSYTWFSELYTDDTYETSLGVAGWGNNYVKEGCELDPGQGFWIQTEQASSVTLPGQVVAADENSFTTTPNKKDIVACVFPVSIDIQGIKLENGTDGCDWIMVFNPQTSSYDSYTWFSELYSDDTYETSLGVPGWGNNYVVETKSLNPGQGFWIQTQADATVSFDAPL